MSFFLVTEYTLLREGHSTWREMTGPMLVGLQNLLYADKVLLQQVLYRENPEVKKLFEEAQSLEDARKRFYAYLTQRELEIRDSDTDPMLRYQALYAINVLKNMISRSSEKLAGFSTLEYIWKLFSQGAEAAGVNEDFILDVIHLFRAVRLEADLYPAPFAQNLGFFDFSKIKGRRAGIERSNYLDRLWNRIQGYLDRYPTGLDKDVIERRIRHKKAILDALGGTLDDWDDYVWQYRNIMKTKEKVDALKDVLRISEEEYQNILKAIRFRIPFGAPPYYLSLMDPEFPWKYDYQIRSQIFPPTHYVRMMLQHREDRSYYFDFMGEHDTSPHDGITRRYVMIAIMKPADTCPQICVYCQRNWELEEAYVKGAISSKKEIDKMVEWFAEHPAIRDVLITGGDPFIMRDHLIDYILKRLSELDHLDNIRFGTRVIINSPMRVTPELAEIIGSYLEPGKRSITVSTHADSAYEITPEVAQAVSNLKKNGIGVYNQQVYTFWVSRRFETFKLRIALRKVGIDPYYSFYPKGKHETLDYQIPVARQIQERKEEARLLPGIFRTDEPIFNVPRLGKNHLMRMQDHELIGIKPDGRRVYMWHPWEKNINHVKPFVMPELVTIAGYLRRLKEKFGDDPEEYKSIWYYY